jgi:hypothetical protein
LPRFLSAPIAICLSLLLGCSEVACAQYVSQAHELNAGTVYSGNASSSDRVEDLTHQILDKVITLEKLNTRFRMETGMVGPWRQRRLFLYGEANAMSTEASLIETMGVRYGTLRKSAHNVIVRGHDRGKLMTADSVQLMGNCVAGSGDLFELNLNFLNYLRIRKHHLNPAAYKEQAAVMHADLIKLCGARTKAINSGQFSESELDVANAETKVLRDFKDLALVEYSNFHSSTRTLWAFQNSAFLVDFLKCAFSGSSSLVQLAGIHVHNPYAQGAAGILSIGSGVAVLIAPIFGRVTGNLAGNASRRLISKDLADVQAKNASEFRESRLKLVGVLLKNPNINSSARLPIYEKEEKLLFDMEKNYGRQRKQARATLIENIAFASAVGPPRLANGTLQIIGGWHYPHRSRANILYASGATAYSAGSAVNILEIARVQAEIELHNYRLGKRGELPVQQLAKRLAVLNEMHSGIDQ